MTLCLLTTLAVVVATDVTFKMSGDGLTTIRVTPPASSMMLFFKVTRHDGLPSIAAPISERSISKRNALLPVRSDHHQTTHMLSNARFEKALLGKCFVDDRLQTYRWYEQRYSDMCGFAITNFAGMLEDPRPAAHGALEILLNLTDPERIRKIELSTEAPFDSLALTEDGRGVSLETQSVLH